MLQDNLKAISFSALEKIKKEKNTETLISEINSHLLDVANKGFGGTIIKIMLTESNFSSIIKDFFDDNKLYHETEQYEDDGYMLIKVRFNYDLQIDFNDYIIGIEKDKVINK
jgi:transcriptional regulator